MMFRSLVALVLLLAVSPLEAQVKVLFLEGKVEYRNGLSGQWFPLAEGGVLPLGAYVRTSPGGHLELELRSQARLFISEQSLVRLRFDDKPDFDRILVHAGTILNQVFAIGKSLQVRTKTAVMGVRGTQFAVVVEPTGLTEVAVKEGRVAVAGPNTGAADSSLVAPDSVAQISSDRVVVRPVTEQDRARYSFSALEAMASGKPLTFEDFRQLDQQDFQNFSAQDATDQLLYRLDELDQWWQYRLAQDPALAEQLSNVGR